MQLSKSTQKQNSTS